LAEADDAIRVGMIDTGDADRWIELGSTRAWNWQQGCMLQWVPGKERQVAWNDREDGRFITRLLDTESCDVRTRASRVGLSARLEALVQSPAVQP
jgi:hypothetical protein